MDRDALIHRIGTLIVTDPVVDAVPWDGYALLVRYDESAGIARRLSGFRYRDDDGFDAATPDNPDLGEALDALRTATQTGDLPRWDACVVQVRRDTRKVHVEFNYDAPERWDITPATLPELAKQLRPPR